MGMLDLEEDFQPLIKSVENPLELKHNVFRVLHRNGASRLKLDRQEESYGGIVKNRAGWMDALF